MREIEFRGKSIMEDTEGKWLYSFGIKYGDDVELLYCDEETSDTWYYVDKEKIGQYTGLKDKNGKKIFEGDIVSYTAIVTEYEENTRPYSYKDIFEGEVTYDYGCFWINDRTLYQIAAYDDEFEPEIEVIGNIYDNPELLKEKL